MNILVFVKQIPDTAEVKLDPKTGNLCRSGVASVINPLDRNAIEAALRLKSEHGGKIAAVTMGPPRASDVLRKALALGCDEAYLLTDRAFGGADTLATSYVLAEAAKKIGGYDLLIFGQHSADGDTAQVGAAVAAFLDVPQVTSVSALKASDGWIECDMDAKNCVKRVKAKLPAVVTVTAEINEPRYASPLGILAAVNAPITAWSAEDLGVDTGRCGTAGSPSITKRVFAPEKGGKGVEYITGSTREMAAKFVDMLAAEHLL